jgi:YbgC/YbaW family acyl-CoA thioester hydrolase
MKEPVKYNLCVIYNVEHIHFGQFDLGGVLYHPRYFHLYEMTREFLLKTHALPYAVLLERDQHLLVSESHQKFINPIFYGKKYTIYLWITNIKKASIVMHYDIIDVETNSLIHKAWTKHAFIEKNAQSFKIAELPFSLLEIMKKYAQDVEVL